MSKGEVDFTDPIIASAVAVAKAVSAEALFAYAGAVDDLTVNRLGTTGRNRKTDLRGFALEDRRVRGKVADRGLAAGVGINYNRSADVGR